MRDHGAVSVGARVRDALQGLGERADLVQLDEDRVRHALLDPAIQPLDVGAEEIVADELHAGGQRLDRKSTRLNSSHSQISYAVFCLKKKKQACKISLHVSDTHCST